MIQLDEHIVQVGWNHQIDPMFQVIFSSSFVNHPSFFTFPWGGCSCWNLNWWLPQNSRKTPCDDTGWWPSLPPQMDGYNAARSDTAGRWLVVVPWKVKILVGDFFTFFYWICWCHTVDGRNPAPVEVGRLSHYLQWFIHPRWSCEDGWFLGDFATQWNMVIIW